MKNLIVLLILIILLSFIGGIPINGKWVFLYQFELVDFPVMIPHAQWYEVLAWVGIILSHFVIILLPFITQRSYFRKLLISAPSVFLICYVASSSFFFILLIPFIICWSIALKITSSPLPKHIKVKTDFNIRLKAIVVLMIVSSLVIGLPIENKWLFLFQLEFIHYPKLILLNSATSLQLLLWIFIVLMHLCIIALTFIFSKRYFKWLLILAPPLYAIAVYFLMQGAIVLLIPFLLLWVLAIFKMNLENKPTALTVS